MNVDRKPDPDSELPPEELETELALASSGVVYVSADVLPAGREVFVGFALEPREVGAVGVRQLLTWAVIGRLALGSDGRVYVHEREIGEHDARKRFRGFATTAAERAVLVEELHRMAFNLTLAITRRRRGRDKGSPP